MSAACVGAPITNVAGFFFQGQRKKDGFISQPTLPTTCGNFVVHSEISAMAKYLMRSSNREGGETFRWSNLKSQIFFQILIHLEERGSLK